MRSSTKRASFLPSTLGGDGSGRRLADRCTIAFMAHLRIAMPVSMLETKSGLAPAFLKRLLEDARVTEAPVVVTVPPKRWGSAIAADRDSMDRAWVSRHLRKGP